MPYLVSLFPSSSKEAAAEITSCLNTLSAVGPNTMSAPDVVMTSVSNLDVVALTTLLLCLQRGSCKLSLLDKGWICAKQHI